MRRGKGDPAVDSDDSARGKKGYSSGKKKKKGRSAASGAAPAS